MKNTTAKSTISLKNKNAGIYAMALLTLLVGIIYILFLTVFAPTPDAGYTLIVDGKRAGDVRFELTQSEAHFLGMCAFIISVVATFVVWLTTRTKREGLTILIAGLSGFFIVWYVSLVISSYFHTTWDSLAAVGGFFLGFIIALVPLFVLLLNIDTDKPAKKQAE